MRSPRRLREIISAPEFVRYFGEPKPDAKDGQTSIFGREDELKNAPKGIAKDHPCVHARSTLTDVMFVEHGVAQGHRLAQMPVVCRHTPVGSVGGLL